MLSVTHYVKLFCSLFIGLCNSSNSEPINNDCIQYIPFVIESNNPSRELALTEQESSCNPFAESPYAKGLRQFTDSTGEWLSLTHCKHLGPFDPYNPEWSMRCGIIYSELLQSDNDFGDYCTNRYIAEMEYNGGHWVIWELEFTNSNSVDDAENVCGKVELRNGRKRSEWACDENYNYPKHISRRQPKYEILGGVICTN